MKKRYAIIGISGRSKLFTAAIQKTYSDRAELVALLDSNSARMEVFNQENKTTLPCYAEQEFEKMVAETKPDCAIISTTDATHHIYLIAALKHNLEVICEKPMTVDTQKTLAIIEAARGIDATKAAITFNYRYAPPHTKIKELVLNGNIGRPTSVEFNYLLDTYHGASYFKRWNRYAKLSGSLLVTKACHHFDLVNWWLNQKPVQVFAYGALNHYGPQGAHNPEKKDGRRCSTCPTKCAYYLRHSSGDGGSSDEHLINFNNPGKNELFGKIDGYYADRCIFDGDIDTWDTFALSVMYDGGTMLSYSLNASCPYEGYKLAINGTQGRLETEAFHGGGMRLPFPPPPPQQIRLFPLFEGRQTIDLVAKGGGHGGGDPLLLRDLFIGPDPLAPFSRHAGILDGAYAVLIGAAARESLKSGQPVDIPKLPNL